MRLYAFALFASCLVSGCAGASQPWVEVGGQRYAIELADNVYVDVDKDGNPAGLEVLGAEPDLLAALPDSPEVLGFRELLKRPAA